MADRNRVYVRIAGNEYILCGNEPADYIQKVALYVDRKTDEIMKANHTLSTSMASVLTAVNVADEMFKVKDIKESIQTELEQMKKALQEIKQEKEALARQLQKANEENRQLVIELTKREAELAEVRNSLAKHTGDNRSGNRMHNK